MIGRVGGIMQDSQKGATQTSKRRADRYEREKRKRELIRKQFEEVCSLLGMDPKTDRTIVLQALLEEVERKIEFERVEVEQKV